MNNISIRIMCACFVVVVAAAIVGVFAYDYVKGGICEQNQSEESMADIIEVERITVEYDSCRITIYHDNQENVTCYAFYLGGISCIPDSQLDRKICDECK